MSRANELIGKTVLVTGASGFLGSRTVAVLSEQGCSVHALVRKTSRTEHLRLPNVTIFVGNVAEATSLEAAFEGVGYVIHAAADTVGSKEGGKLSTIHGTQNILTLSERYRVKKLVYISSCNVYGVVDCRQGQMVTEESSLERFPEKRGPYSHAKLEAERLALKAMEHGTVPVVCLRPGTIYGPGASTYTPMLGFSLGNRLFAVIGDGRFVLPLVYVDNLVQAVIVALNMPSSRNQIYNVVDPQKVTKKDFMEGLVKKLYPGSLTIYIPFSMVKMAVFLQEKFFEVLEKRPFLTTYRLISSQKRIVYDASKISKDLAWNPPVSVETAYGSLIKYESGRN